MKICPYCGYRGTMIDEDNGCELICPEETMGWVIYCPECGKEFNEDEN